MRRSGGTGLGLSISVEDANLHDGKLEAWGRPGVGASFRLTLPLVRGQKLGKSPQPLEPGMRRAPRRPHSESERAGGERVELGPPVTETEPWAPLPAPAEPDTAGAEPETPASGPPATGTKDADTDSKLRAQDPGAETDDAANPEPSGPAAGSVSTDRGDQKS
jgi:two-component system sensor histidine kinase MtrB